jgi:hypothetical protein
MLRGEQLGLLRHLVEEVERQSAGVTWHIVN